MDFLNFAEFMPLSISLGGSNLGVIIGVSVGVPVAIFVVLVVILVGLAISGISYMRIRASRHAVGFARGVSLKR